MTIHFDLKPKAAIGGALFSLVMIFLAGYGTGNIAAKLFQAIGG